MATDYKPNPGSDAARKGGCKCPIIDNRYGAGAYIDDHGHAQFCKRDDCPMHGVANGDQE